MTKMGAPLRFPPLTGDPVRDRIINIRRRFRLSQAALGKWLHVSDEAVSQWESGQTAPSGPALVLLEQMENRPDDAASTPAPEHWPVDHARKIRRAWKLAASAVPRGPLTVEAIMAPLLARPRLLEELTARGLAAVIEALNEHWHAARAFEAAEILTEGAVWDNKARKLRDIAA